MHWRSQAARELPGRTADTRGGVGAGRGRDSSGLWISLENADFADLVEAEGFIFVGPTGASIRAMGDKATARKLAEEAGVPTTPGSKGVVASAAEAAAIAERIGYPVLLKASAGGGGRECGLSTIRR